MSELLDASESGFDSLKPRRVFPVSVTSTQVRKQGEKRTTCSVCNWKATPIPPPILLPDGYGKDTPFVKEDFSMGRIPVQFKAVEGR